MKYINLNIQNTKENLNHTLKSKENELDDKIENIIKPKKK